MKILRNERTMVVLPALLLAVSFLILDVGIQYGSQKKWFTGNVSKVEAVSLERERERNRDPRGTLVVQYEEVEQMEEDPEEDMDKIEVEEKLLRARMEERGVEALEEL